MSKVNFSKLRLKNIGLGLLICAALFLLFFPYMPEVTYNLKSIAQPKEIDRQIYLNSTINNPVPTGRRLIIPTIEVDSPIVEGSEVGVLDREAGVWHQTGDILSTNLVIAGHRFKYLPPNQTTFYHLNKLRKDDLIVIFWDGIQYSYSVSEIFEVANDDISILNPTARQSLTLYTCADELLQRRLVVRAKIYESIGL